MRLHVCANADSPYLQVDLLLHPLKSELNWPLGDKMPLDLTKDKLSPGLRWQLPFHCLDALFFASEGVCVMEVTRSTQSEELLRRLSAAVEEGVASKATQPTSNRTRLQPPAHDMHVYMCMCMHMWFQPLATSGCHLQHM